MIKKLPVHNCVWNNGKQLDDSVAVAIKYLEKENKWTLFCCVGELEDERSFNININTCPFCGKNLNDLSNNDIINEINQILDTKANRLYEKMLYIQNKEDFKLVFDIAKECAFKKYLDELDSKVEQFRELEREGIITYSQFERLMNLITS
ncbi:MAG: hypothetical protein ACOCRX_03200 [Candidatus Woesearchaeota archaeon]